MTKDLSFEGLCMLSGKDPSLTPRLTGVLNQPQYFVNNDHFDSERGNGMAPFQFAMYIQDISKRSQYVLKEKLRRATKLS